MTGYQEIMTDPSYAGQIINFTFPHIGNVGTNVEDVEAINPHALGAIQDDPAKRTLCLEPDKQDRRIPARQVVKQVMPDAACLAHARGCENDRARNRIEPH